MVSYKTIKIIPVALTLIIIAISIAALVSLVRVVFFSGDNTAPTVSQADIVKEALLSSDVEHNVILTVRGPIVADESFRSYQIKINANIREINIYRGYLDQPIDKISLNNNIKSYEQFIFSLYRSNLIKGIELTGDKNDLRGICATGYVYNFEVFAHNKDEKQLWTSTCAGSKGSLDANADQLINLYVSQIPGAKDLIGKTFK